MKFVEVMSLINLILRRMSLWLLTFPISFLKRKQLLEYFTRVRKDLIIKEPFLLTFLAVLKLKVSWLKKQSMRTSLLLGL